MYNKNWSKDYKVMPWARLGAFYLNRANCL